MNECEPIQVINYKLSNSQRLFGAVDVFLLKLLITLGVFMSTGLLFFRRNLPLVWILVILIWVFFGKYTFSYIREIFKSAGDASFTVHKDFIISKTNGNSVKLYKPLNVRHGLCSTWIISNPLCTIVIPKTVISKSDLLKLADKQKQID